jgi:hypothetical protein
MRLTDREVTSLNLKRSVLQRVDVSGPYTPKITLSQALWCMFPVLFYYAWEGILW